jgi:hypothetical protein
MVKLPYCPTVLACATKVAGLSTSLIVSVPPVDRIVLVSVRLRISVDNTAASLAPPMPIVTNCGVPSTVVTVKVSVNVPPALSA